MIAQFLRWLFSSPPTSPVHAPPPEPRASFFTTDLDNEDAYLTRSMRWERLQAKVFPRTIRDTLIAKPGSTEAVTYAMDEAADGSSIKSMYSLTQAGVPEGQVMWYGSQGFIGYQMCAILAQHWLIDKACSMPAQDAIRKGYKLTANDGAEVATEVLAALEKSNKRHRLNRALVEFVKMGRVFGIRVALCKVQSDDPEYYLKPFNLDAITPGSYRGMVQIDPYWCVPELTSSTASDPSNPEFYNPTYWIINGQRHHRSHLIIMRGPEVPDLLKPAYLYGGLSIPQRIYERVYAAERTANEAPQLALSKRATVIYTDVAKALANQAKFEERLSVWAQYRDNFGVKVADKVDEQIDQIDTNLSNFDEVIMTQYQLVAAIANVPATKLLGTTPKGFNATGNYEEASYHEELESIQVNDMEPFIERHVACVIRSDIAPTFGINPFSVDVTWEPLDSMTKKEAAEVRKIEAEADKIYAVDIGSVSGEEVRAKLAKDEHSGFDGLAMIPEDDGLPDADEEA